MDQILQGMQAATVRETGSDEVQMLAAHRSWENPLRFVIWIDSLKPSGLALEDSCHLVYKPPASQIRAH